MATTTALVISSEQAAAIQEVPVPPVRDDWLLVETKAVALNPADWKHIDHAFGDAGSRLGCDYAGVVLQVGKNVTQYKKGDRVAGFCHGGNQLNHDTGAFGNTLLAKASASIKIPDNVDFVEASTFAVGVFTCGLGLFHSLGLPLPGDKTEESIPVLIHGGATTTGIWAIQLAKQAGLTVITTASPSNFDYLRSLGADHVLDYHSPTCGADIRSLTNNKLRHAWDCPGGGEALCVAALSTELPSKYGAINFPDFPDSLRATNPLVEGPIIIIAYNVPGEVWMWQGEAVTPDPKEVEFSARFKEIVRDLLEKRKIKTPRVGLNVGGAGLEGVLKGLDELRQGKVKGQKLVYTL